MKRTLCALILVVSFVSYCSSQVATGVLPFNSYGGGPFDTVNLGNLNVHFTIPVLHKAGRGTPFAYDLNYDSSIYRPVVSNGTTSWVPVTNVGNITSYWGWQGLGPVYSPYVAYQVTYSSGMCGQYGNQPWSETSYGNAIYYDTTGTPHPLGAGGAVFNSPGPPYCPPNGPQPSGTVTATASDGSGLLTTYSVSSGFSGYIQTKDGSTINVPWLTGPPTGSSPYTTTDRNGNKITFSNGTYTDTLGQAVLVAMGTAPNPVTFSYIPPANESSGTRVSVTANFVNYTVQTNFNAKDSGGHAIAEYRSTSVVALVDNVTLPDGTQYKFQYEATPSTPSSGACTPISGTTCTTGRIAKVTLPTGGTITYTYTGGVSGANGIFNDGSTAGLSRQLSSPGGQWTYARSQVSGNYWTTTMTSPTGDNMVLDFTEDSASTNPTFSFYETFRQVNQLVNGTQTPLLTTTSCWNGTSSSCTSTAIASPITERAVTAQYPNNGQQSKTDTTYNAFGLSTNIKQYAYSTGAPTTLLRQIAIFYGNYYTASGSWGCTVLANNIVDVPCNVIVTDGGGNVLSQTTYVHDEYAVQATTGTPQQSSVTGSRGNATTISTAVSQNPSSHAITAWMTRHNKYYDTGNLYQSQDVNGQWTTYTYSTAAQGNSTKSCGNSFPTSFTLPISGLASLVSTGYDCYGGVVTAVTDFNGNSTTTTYNDANFWRAAQVVAPYTPTSSTTTKLSYTTTSVDSAMTFNGTSSVVEYLTTLGNFGQMLYSQQHEGPSSGNWDTRQTNYDSFVRPYQSTMPCVTISGSGCPSAAVTTSTFDALGRVTKVQDGGNPTPGWVQYTYSQNDVLQVVGPAPSNENSKQKQLEYDALGRLTSVCEITQNASPNTCGQIGGNQNGYVTTYTYGVNSSGYPYVKVTQGPTGSQQTRTYTYDLLARLLSEVNPENGTTTYTYDSDSAGTCSGTYTGDLVKLTDAKGNKICYQYDAIHRNSQITYPSGPDAGNTPSKTFIYDSATFNGQPIANPKGRLVEAYTGSSSSKTTDEFFQYSVRGELTDTWECTPHSGTNGCASVSNYYHAVAGFWENGGLKSLSSNITGLPTQTYSVDSMGRTSAVNASSGQNPVTSTSYNLSTFTYGVTFGSGDSDTFTMDPSTGRMTQYKFNVGTLTVTGNLTWNPNGSLNTLGITNQLNSLDTQNCSYTHDDLARISSVNCTNGSTNRWNQNFSYDAFGNITKTVPPGGTGGSFQPTYSSLTNWMTSLPGTTPTYDTDGRLTYDGIHNYAWDVEGKLYTVDTTTLTHDALGRMVEKASGSAYTQFVYGPLGNRFAVMNGQTLQKALVPLPAAQAVYTSTGLTYYRHKDQLGSSRLATTPNQTLYSSTAYAPFGESYSQAGNTDLSFTGQDQDTVSGIYDFMFRKYNPTHGRWLSPDPAGLSAVNPANPQTWNRYAYVMNNPMSLVDPLGLYCGWDDGTYDANPEDGGASQSECEAQGGTWYDGNSPNNDPIVVPGETVNVAATVDPLDAYDASNAGSDPTNGLPLVPYIAPGASDARTAVIAILSQKNPCSNWFNGAEGGILKAASDLFSAVPIKSQYVPITPEPNGQIGMTHAMTDQGNLTSPIILNTGGGFFEPGMTIGSPDVPGGTYPSGTIPAQIAILLHEMAHKMNLIPRDASSVGQSENNTKTVLQNCAGAINGD